ncbi:hypothetical protein D6810_01120 [Candidatus Dojkabacteria bacterium]|uniref:Methyltransferase small domain-containing protein n=1 Tax=Candidatus Dojkabacteria bacterium TaxID=2099670 RepID=A0A3M0YZ58_9BACT|nr:MAG: hypothetical protein D6810_01120 [Candidatus Dojkabacteria bacterium]
MDKYNPLLRIHFQFEHKGFLINFVTQHGTQSAQKIDTVSKLIIEKVKIGQEVKSVFVSNAGYGSFSIPMALENPKVEFELTDRDFVNVNLIKENIKNNDLKNCINYLSDGLEHAKKKEYDLVLLNYNRQFGKVWLENFLSSSASVLSSRKGKLILVTHRSLKEFVKRLTIQKFGNYKKVFHDNNYYILST